MSEVETTSTTEPTSAPETMSAPETASSAPEMTSAPEPTNETKPVLPPFTRAPGGMIKRVVENSPYEFSEDGTTITFLPLGKSYRITAPGAVKIVNMLTAGMESPDTDWFVEFSNFEANILRSSCRDFLVDCVEREPRVGPRIKGNHKYGKHTRMRREPLPVS